MEPASVCPGLGGARDHSWKPLTTSSRPDACTRSVYTCCRLRPPHVSLIDRRGTNRAIYPSSSFVFYRVRSHPIFERCVIILRVEKIICVDTSVAHACIPIDLCESNDNVAVNHGQRRDKTSLLRKAPNKARHRVDPLICRDTSTARSLHLSNDNHTLASS